MTYQEIKDWLKEKDNKNKIVVGLSLVLMFVVGYGAGSYVRETRRSTYAPKANYTTLPAKKPVAEAVAEQGNVAGAATSTQGSASCPVKGNISASTGKKIYHIPGGAFYKKVKPEQCFNTEAEALAAGFVKSSR